MVPEETGVVERLIRRTVQGQSLPSTATRVREVDAPMRNGGAWRPSTIRRILQNHFYTARVEYDGAVIDARHDAIVSDAVFDRCRR